MISLSTIRVDPASGILRDCPRPAELRHPHFAGQYDWDTLFYDVYRAGRHVVFQGPPLFNFLDHLQAVAPFKRAFGFPWFAARSFALHKRGEIWLRSDADRIDLDCALGQFSISVQPDQAAKFAGRRVLTTISKDNDLRWIADWVAFYHRVHGADAVLLYNNNSNTYSLEQLQATLDQTNRDIAGGTMVAQAVDWPFKFGPQGGIAALIEGVDVPWDCDFCQIGSLQHARFRFLRRAASVLNVDIDELVLPAAGQTIFAAAETSRTGLVKFPGLWIGTHVPYGTTRESCRHADYVFREQIDARECPPKWCVVPGRGDRMKDTWSIHNLAGAKANRFVSERFAFRHMRAITTSWKEDRWQNLVLDPAGPFHDDELEGAMNAAGLATSQFEEPRAQ